MPTSTFEHLGTTTVTGSSTTQVEFTSINQSTYLNFMLIGSVIMNSSSEQICIRVNGATSGYLYQSCYTGPGANNTNVPVSGRNTDSLIALSQYNVNATGSNPTIFRATFSGNTGRTEVLCESWHYIPASNTINFTLTNGGIQQSMPSLQIRGYSGGAFQAGSVFSLYGMI
jgi:hypothetical protein